MAAIVDGKWSPEIILGKWEQSDERSDLIVPDKKTGKPSFMFNKGNKSSLPAAYNPYFHTSNTPLNDQFSSAYKRPNLVTLEVLVPKSELTSGYQAKYAKDPVGMMTWHNGVIAGKLPPDKARKVILSRWDKPIRIVPDREVAQKIAKLLDGENIPFPSNVITPNLRAELEKLGVPIFEKTLERKNQVDTIEYSLERTPESVDDFRAMEAHPRPPKAEFSSVKELYDIYKAEYLDKTITTISGHDNTFKPGHFFLLIAGAPTKDLWLKLKIQLKLSA